MSYSALSRKQEIPKFTKIFARAATPDIQKWSQYIIFD
jgi:hypothetical protein